MRERIRSRLRRAAGIEALEAELAQARADLARLEHEARARERSATAEAGERGEWQARIAGRLETLELRAQVPVVMATAARAALAREPLVSVVMPTRNRAAALSRAIESVIAQTYRSWELIVVDDGGTDDTGGVLESIADERVRPLRREHAGLGAARNAGLEAARGELIAYLDDDNLMDPGWIRTVAWGFERRPDAVVLYGGYVIDDVERLNQPEGGGPPGLVLNPFSRERLADANPADISAVAHRAGIDGARFDERLAHLGDWELLARLTSGRDPFVVPAIACYYGTGSPDRLSLTPPDPHELAAVRRACESGAPPGH